LNQNTETPPQQKKGGTPGRGHKKVKNKEPRIEVEIHGNVGGVVGSMVKFELILRYSNGEAVQVAHSKLNVHIDGSSANVNIQLIAKGGGNVPS